MVHRQAEIRTYQGPVPPPEQMEHFERVLPGMADRILAMAEGNAGNRWRNDRAQRTVAILGQVFAFLITAMLVGGGLWLTSLGRAIEGFATICGTVAAIVWAFRRATAKKQQ